MNRRTFFAMFAAVIAAPFVIRRTGHIDDLMIAPKALSADEISLIYQNTK